MIIDTLREDMKSAMKAGEKARLSVIRMLISELKNARIDKGEDLSDAEEQKVLTSYAKKRKEAIENCRKNGRDELAEKEQAEYDITVSYLPEQMGEAELRAVIKKHIEADKGEGQVFGRIMKAVMAEVSGRADGKMISALVREMLE